MAAFDDADVQVADEHQDWGAGVGPADADVVQLAPARKVSLPSD